jgi:hypothetical protein
MHMCVPNTASTDTYINITQAQVYSLRRIRQHHTSSRLFSPPLTLPRFACLLVQMSSIRISSTFRTPTEYGTRTEVFYTICYETRTSTQSLVIRHTLFHMRASEMHRSLAVVSP